MAGRNMGMKKYKKIAVGGTFDRFHEGHQRLLNKAFQLSDTVLIGVTSDEFAQSKGKIEPCNQRMSHLKEKLEKFSGSYSVSRLDDSCGPAIAQDDIEALVVSEETEPTAHLINDIRKKRGMKTVEVITSVQRRRRWSAEDKKAFVEEAEQPGMSISAVARKYGIHLTNCLAGEN